MADKIIINSLIRRWDDRVPRAIRSVLKQSYTHWVFYILATPESAPHIQAFLEGEPEDTTRVHVEIEEAKDFVEGIAYLTKKIWEQAPLGDYFCNLDGDDALAPNFLKKQLKAMKSTQADVACCGIERYLEGTKEIDRSKTLPVQQVMNRSQMTEFVRNYLDAAATIWGKLYRSKLFTPETYQELPDFASFGGVGHDTITVLTLLKRCRRVVITEGVGYYYTLWEGSLAHAFTLHREKSSSMMYQRLREFFLHFHPSLHPLQEAFLYQCYGNRLFHLAREVYESEKSDREKFQLFHQSLTDTAWQQGILLESPEHMDWMRQCYHTSYHIYQGYNRSFSPIQEDVNAQDERSFYELFLTLWPESREALTYEIFVEKAFVQKNLKALQEGDYQQRNPEAELQALLAELEREL